MEGTSGEDQTNEPDVSVVPDAFGTQEQFSFEVVAELRELRESFDSKIRYDEVKERQIEALHEELQGHRHGLYQQILQPVMMDLIDIYDEMAEQAAWSPEGPDSGLGSLAEMVEEVLARYGVARYEVDGEAIDRSRQKVIGTQDTGNPELGKRLARRLRPGFEMKGKVIRPEWVVTYRYVLDAAQSASE